MDRESLLNPGYIRIYLTVVHVTDKPVCRKNVRTCLISLFNYDSRSMNSLDNCIKINSKDILTAKVKF